MRTYLSPSQKQCQLSMTRESCHEYWGWMHYLISLKLFSLFYDYEYQVQSTTIITINPAPTHIKHYIHLVQHIHIIRTYC